MRPLESFLPGCRSAIACLALLRPTGLSTSSPPTSGFVLHHDYFVS
jgi:hypothetical protein